MISLEKFKEALDMHHKKYGASKEAAMSYLVNILGTHRKNGELRANYGGTSSPIMNRFAHDKRYESPLQEDIYQTALDVNDRLPESSEKDASLNFLLTAFNNPSGIYSLTHVKAAFELLKIASCQNKNINR